MNYCGNTAKAEKLEKQWKKRKTIKLSALLAFMIRENCNKKWEKVYFKGIQSKVLFGN